MSVKKVLILMGSANDLDVMRNTAEALGLFGIDCDLHIASAHRTPQKVIELVSGARRNGYGVVIAGAGMAAHLGGVAAAHTTLPVIGVPLAAGELAGVDALLSSVQMPRGVALASMGIGEAGAFNAGLMAAAMLSIADQDIAEKLASFREKMARKVEEKDLALSREK
ncbi:MAG TPA: 5-(carboxyamino)imidazole ribonucleotide mutase [Myxococcota bacterium]|nr:5-(carboxyamino)imidazole ribonucleotide mutase [Myxococcota bacterium]